MSLTIIIVAGLAAWIALSAAFALTMHLTHRHRDEGPSRRPPPSGGGLAAG
jgi:hypothetical protein